MHTFAPAWSRWLLILSLVWPLLVANPAPVAAAGRNEIRQSDATSGPAGRKPPPVDIEDELGETDTSDAVDNLREVRSAVIQIEAVGTFRSPEEGMQYSVSGVGSGFIIDPGGIAVTNNHVVTGAALLKVFVAGEEKPRNARVLGVSECSDLAVIDIEGDGFPYLAWYEGPLEAGLEVYSAGFPLGDPEYTLTDGIVAKAEADGESEWASVDHVVEHTAQIKPGNSGGPLVTADGQVAAVNYAGSDDDDQFYAIAGDIALPIIEQLRSGQNVDTIGLNGEVIPVGDDGLQGIWVASVASGSPADNSGIKPGDILLMLEGILVAEDGTMSTYCDILRSHSPDDVMSIEVLRPDTEEWLEGQLNGRPLALKSDIGAGGAEENTPSANEAQSEPESYESFVTLENRAGTLSMEVPEDWTDSDDTEWILDDEPVGIRLIASPDVEDFLNSWETPGVMVSVSESLVKEYDAEDVLDFSDYSDQCELDDRYELESDYYTGVYDVWEGCGDVGAVNYIVALIPPEGNYVAKIEATTLTDADVDALNHVIDSFSYQGVAAANTGNTDNLGSDIFEIVDTSGLAYDYTFIRHPALSALVPSQWDEIKEGDWESDGEVIGSTLDVAADLEAYYEWTTEPGMSVHTVTGFNEDVNIDELLDKADYSDSCTYESREKHSHTIYGRTYSGAFDIWTDCNGEENVLVSAIVVSEPADQVVLIDFFMVSEDDVDALDVLAQSFLVENGEEVVEATGETGAPTSDEPQFQTISDNAELLSVSVPVDWEDVQSGDWVRDEEKVGVYVAAAPDLEGYFDTWNTPGIFYGASTELAQTMSVEEFLDESSFSNDCTLDDRLDYEDAVFVGAYDLWTDCGGEGTIFVNLAVTLKENEGVLLLVQVALPEGTGQEVLEQILSTFTISESVVGEDEDGSEEASEATEEVDESADTGTAVVLAETLNVRAGPGTNYGRIGAVQRDDELTITGQVSNCAWLQVTTPDGTEGWVSGGAQYVTINADCAAIPVVEAPPPPRTSSGGSASSGGNTGAAAGKGCYTFQNQLGAELNITFTKADGSWNKTFKVARGGEYRECFDPGKYTYTLDAPPPWGSTNGELTVSAGDNYAFPITPGE